MICEKVIRLESKTSTVFKAFSSLLSTFLAPFSLWSFLISEKVCFGSFIHQLNHKLGMRMNVIACKLKPRPFNYQIPRSTWIYVLHVSECSVREQHLNVAWFMLIILANCTPKVQQLDGGSFIGFFYAATFALCAIRFYNTEETQPELWRNSSWT